MKKPLQANSYTNINKMRKEFTGFVDELFDLQFAKEQGIDNHCHLDFPGTSIMINKVKTQKRLLVNKPPSYWKQLILKLENQITDSTEKDRIL